MSETVEVTPPRDIILQEKIKHELGDFVEHPALTDLMGRFGYKPPEGYSNLTQKLAHMQEFTKEHWNPRQGGERNQAGKLDLTEEEQSATRDAAKALGMVEATKPALTEYDGIVILGAGGRHALERAKHARETGVKTNTVYFLSGDMTYNTQAIQRTRATETERDEITELYDQRLIGLDEKYGGKIPEFEFAQAAAEAVYGDKITGTDDKPTAYKRDDHEIAGEELITYHYEGDDPDNNPDLVILRARNRAPHERTRTNTSDSYSSLEELLPEKRQGTRLLLSTTGLFVPFQHFGARRMLTVPYGIDVETIGTDTQKTSPAFDAPERYIQEMNAAVIEANALQKAI
jgi:hypothetical protein